jgi:predicted Zn-dependent protease
MVIRIILVYAAFLTAVLFLQGCSVNPVTGKNELSFMSSQQEIALGEKNYQPSRQSQGGDYYLDAKLQAYVAGVGKKLAAVSDQPDLPYEFVVLNNSVPNAWALPGGKIAINRGLLMYLEDESQLAAVLAHEIVHAAARHGASKMTRGALGNIGIAALGIGTAGREGAQLYSMASQLGAAAWMAKYGRDDELESDYYGMNYMAKAGYEPDGAVELQQVFVKLSEGRQTDFLRGLFASHPPSIKRVQANIAKAQTLPRGQRYKARYQTAIAQLRKDANAYKAAEAGAAALKKKDGKAALNELDRAIAIQPGEASFWELRGQAWKMINNDSNAEKAFTTAIGKNPEYFSGYLARGILRYDRGQKDLGLADIKSSYALLPTPAASYYLGESALASQQYQQAASYFKQAIAAGGEIGKRSLHQLNEVRLQLEPQLFLSAQLSLTEEGYLLVTTKNNSPVSMAAIQVQLSVLGDGRRLTLPQTIPAGRELRISTGIGPITDADKASQYRVRVVTAKALK